MTKAAYLVALLLAAMIATPLLAATLALLAFTLQGDVDHPAVTAPVLLLVGLLTLGALSALVALAPGRERVGAARILVFGAVAFAAVVVSTRVPASVTRENVDDVPYGYPVQFVHADMTRYSPPSYPWRFAWNPWEDPAAIDPARFLASYLLVAGSLVAVWRTAASLRRRLAA